MSQNRTSILPSLGLEALVGTDEGTLSEVGKKVKALLSTYEAALAQRREKHQKRPPVDLYRQMTSELKSNLPFEEYKQVVSALVDEVVRTLKHDPSLWNEPYGSSLEVTALKNIYSFATVAMEKAKE